MATLTHNSQEFIKSKVAYAQDQKTAVVRSEDICYQSLAVDRDEAWNEAVDYLTNRLFAGKSFELSDNELVIIL